MASPNTDLILKTRITTLRDGTLSYKPGVTVFCDDKRVIFPDKIVIVFNVSYSTGFGVYALPALKRALYGDSEHQTSTKDQRKEFLTNYIYVATRFTDGFQAFPFATETITGDAHELAGKVGCMVMFVDPTNIYVQRFQEWIRIVKTLTGRAPLCGMLNIGESEDMEDAKDALKEYGITDIYELPRLDTFVNNPVISNEGRLQCLDFLHGCLCEADVVMLQQLYSDPSFQKICMQERKEAKEAEKRHEGEIREREEEQKLLQRSITELEQGLNESRASLESKVIEYASLKDSMKVEHERRQRSEIAMTENEKRAKHAMEMSKQRELELDEKLKSKELQIGTMAEKLQKTEEAARRKVERLQTILKQQVEELEKGREEDRSLSEKQKHSLAAEMTKKLESKQQHVDTLKERLGEKEKNETILKQQVEELKKGREKDRSISEKEKHSLAAEMTKKLESKQQHVDTLKERIEEKERNETIMKQQVEELEKGREEDRSISEKEKHSLAAEMTSKLESKQQHVDTLKEMLEEKERNETIMKQQVEELEKGREEDRSISEKEKQSLASEMTSKLESKQQHVDTLKERLEEKERNETIMKQQVEELEKGREKDRSISEKEKHSLAAEMTKKLESKQQQVDTLKERIGEKERNETIMKQQVDELEKGREEDRSICEKEKHSLAAEMKLESKQQHVDTLKERLHEKEKNETTLRQQVEELKNEGQKERARFENERRSIESSRKKELASREKRMEQLERETWKLRTKLQLESEVRSAEHKKKAESLERQIIRWMTSRKHAPGERSNAPQAEEEQPNDEFANIVKQIADDLSDEAKIDSLGSQLGIIQGDIARALKTNMRYEQVTSRGTHLMLKQWREGVSMEDERIELRRALVAANLLDLADRYVPQKENTVEDHRQREAESRQLFGIDGTPSVHGNPEERSKKHKTKSTTGLPHLDDMSFENQGETVNEEEAVVGSAPSNRERTNLDEGEYDADEANARDITPNEIQPDFQEPSSAHRNDGNDDIVDVLDREMDENDQDPQSAHIDDIDSTRALQISEEPASEEPCCSCCYPFRNSQFR